MSHFMRVLRGVTTLSAALFASAACQSAPDAPGARVAPPPQKTKTMSVLDSRTQSALDAQMQEIAGTASYTVTSVKDAVWRDASLGCPMPGMHYAQVLTPGQIVVINHDGKSYRFHTSQRGVARLCPAGRAKAPIQREHPDA